MKRIFALLAFFTLFCACSDSDESVSLCDCEPDEYCVDDECIPTNSSVAPAPSENK
ncbi:MAG: hypothetical protein IJU23_07390 [Proteobacteria bacterium]|nr:hypothetical protein [Pseudomonadota bacterium]